MKFVLIVTRWNDAAIFWQPSYMVMCTFSLFDLASHIRQGDGYLHAFVRIAVDD